MKGDPAPALLRALLAGAPPVELVEMESRDWASSTFAGARHSVRLLADDDDALTAWLAALPDAAPRVPGHLVVDVAASEVVRQGGRAAVTISALTVEG